MICVAHKRLNANGGAFCLRVRYLFWNNCINCSAALHAVFRCGFQKQKQRKTDVLKRPYYKTNMSLKADWQTTRPTIRERTTFLLNNDRLSDVKFVAANSNGESTQLIAAHKFILAIGSPVFEAMFYGELAETKDTIELPDCDYESLLELFRYIYSDEVNLSGSNVMGMLYLAKKYIVPSLADKCTEYLKEKIDPSNVFDILSFAQKYHEGVIVDRCWKFIDQETDEALEPDGFETIDKSLLEAVVTRDSLKIREVVLFQAVDRWARKQCQKQGLAEDGEMKRRILGEQIIKAIRFPVMSVQEFASVVVDTNILTPDETTGLFKFFTIQTSPVGFSKTQRRPLVNHDRFSRFISFTTPSALHEGIRYDVGKHSLAFAADQSITLHGVCLIGRYNSSYTVTLEVKNVSNNTTIVSKSGTYSSELLPYGCCPRYYGFQVSFDCGADMKSNTRYHIEALISGPPSGYGTKGLKTINRSGVTFTFYGLKDSYSSIYSGQFSEFIFSV